MRFHSLNARQHMVTYSAAMKNADHSHHYGVVQRFMIAGIRFYRRFLSPLKTTKCPYIPTCSEYGLEAVERYGALKGGMMALWRILRCNPFSHGGYDPVP